MAGADIGADFGFDGSGGNTDAKAWKDIWGCGQGIGAIKEVTSTAELVDRLVREYNAAKESLLDIAG